MTRPLDVRALVGRAVLAFLLAVLALPGIAGAQTAGGTLGATPNPCVIPAGKTVCTSTLTWTSSAADAEVWISNTNGTDPKLFARAQGGTSLVTWISSRTTRFHLKRGGWDGLTMATADVRGAPGGLLAATPSPCVIPAGKTVCTVTLAWTSSAPDAEVWITDTDGADPKLVARSQNGSTTVPWIAAHATRFHLKGGNWNAPTLSTVDVRGLHARPPVSLTRRYVYDAHHRLCKIIEPETGATVIGYDAAGIEYWRASGLDLPSATSCDHLVAWHSGRRVTRTHDARNRVTKLNFPDGRGNQEWHYTPDSLPELVVTRNDPDDEPVYNLYSYNARRQLTEELLQQDWITSTIRHGYNIDGHRVLYTMPDGLEVRIGVDGLGRPVHLTDQRGNLLAYGVQYHPNGALKQFTYGNGIVRTQTQSARQLPERIADVDGGVAILDDGLDFDANGNVAAITDGATARHQRGNRTMAYDGLDRLVSTESPMFGTARYGYDALDRLTHAHVTGGTTARDHAYCHDASARLTNVKTGGCSGASVIGLGYDVQGNVVNRNGQAFDFDYGNRLREATGKERYRYDAQGRRVTALDASGVPIRSHYDQADRLAYQRDERRDLGIAHVYLGNRLIATVERGATTGVGRVRYQHTDALGTPVVVTDEERNVVERSEYEPYGRLLNRPVADGVGYTGHVMDAATGNVYLQDRYMDPLLGVFLSTDPVTAYGTGDWRLFGRYGYAFNNPYRFTDPDGRQSREFNLENQRLGIRPPPRSEKDWLGPALGYALGGIIAAPIAGYVATSSIGGPLVTGAAETAAGDALGGASLSAGGALLYRVVDDVELASILKLGTFSPSPNGDEVKRFLDNLPDARALQQKFIEFFGGNQHVVQGMAPRQVIDSGYRTPLSDVPGRPMESVNVPSNIVEKVVCTSANC